MGVSWSSASTATMIHYADKPALIPVRQHEDAVQGEGELDMRTLVEKRCPSLHKPFVPAWWLPNGHAQTLYCVLGDFTKSDRMRYQRTFIRMKEGGTVAMDWAPIDQEALPDDTPIIVVKHGLTGGSYEAYVRSILYTATKPKSEGGLGYRAVVCNFRGCAGTPVTSQQLYSAGYTEDLRQEVMYIRHLYPNAPLLGIGFSLGANVLTRYLAQDGSESRLVSGCALACPWDLAANSDGLVSTFLGTHIYSKGMARNLLRLVGRHRDALAKDPEHPAAHLADEVLALKRPTLEEFDEVITSKIGGPPPEWPFPSARAYYTHCSSHHVVKDIRVPFLAINAADDPVVTRVPMDGGGNGMVVMALTPHGGHLGWFEGVGTLPGQTTRWVREPVLEWMRMNGEEVAHEKLARKERRVYVDEEGWVREEGSEHLGCRRIAGGGIIDGSQQQNVGEEGMLQGL
ncbi:Alpha/Beta hydrolase protein [Schizophyllum fasciatum]